MIEFPVFVFYYEHWRILAHLVCISSGPFLFLAIGNSSFSIFPTNSRIVSFEFNNFCFCWPFPFTRPRYKQTNGKQMAWREFWLPTKWSHRKTLFDFKSISVWEVASRELFSQRTNFRLIIKYFCALSQLENRGKTEEKQIYT